MSNGSAKGRLLERSPELPDLLPQADVVVGVDIEDPKNRSIFYGRRTLDRIIKSNEASALAIMEVPIDYATNDLEVLVYLCTSIKGSCCYMSDETDDPIVNPDVN